MLVYTVCVICALVPTSRASQPDASIWVDVAPQSSPDNLEVERRYTPEVLEQLQSTQADALLLYTEYTARASSDMKAFIKNISRLSDDTVNNMDRSILEGAPATCRTEFEKRLKKIEYDAHRTAIFSGENHHKFFLGHMIVFRIHLNKSEEYIKKCARVIQTCGTACETTPRITRWRRLALAEIHRVRDDIQHSRRSYRDLLVHLQRKLNHTRRRATTTSKLAVDTLQACIRKT